MMQNLPIGMQSFESIRQNNFLYVDKTKHIYNLANSNRYYFLSRPRRFGKSLFLSTLEAYFLGKKELFKGLYIETVEKQWTEYPVLYLDMNSGIYDSEERLLNSLNYHLSEWEKEYSIQTKFVNPEDRFSNIIKTAVKQTGKQVVILVDEYDKPLLQTIDNEELHDKFKGILKGVYSVLKGCDKYIRFGMLTGVTKFSKISLFSDLNNLMDISLDENYTDICGITEEEIKTNFKEHLQAFAEKESTTKEDILSQLKAMYDGYHFSENISIDIYNPFSLLNSLTERKFRNYWFQTGTPTFLIKLLKENDYDLKDFSEGNITARDLTSKESMLSAPVALFYQSGYITIKDYDKELQEYTLGYPNKEVEQSFLEFLLPRYVHTIDDKSASYLSKFIKDLRAGRVEDFLEKMKVFFAGIPYDIIKDTENYYQTILFLICRLVGFYSQAEYRTSRGRMDMLIKTKDYIYVFEFKFDKSAKEALEQIDSKDYPLAFQQDERKLYKIGVNFSSQTKNIDEYIIQ
ncbi:MAG: ATP-binding protein [Bacteroidales bacterium]|nr:ATP-binding protein [Bacteroidales bacterium]